MSSVVQLVFVTVRPPAESQCLAHLGYCRGNPGLLFALLIIIEICSYTAVDSPTPTTPMSVASADTSCSDDDNLSNHINNLLEPELRSVLQHIALVHPEVVQVAIKHQQFLGDDMYSVVTQQVSNTSKRRTDDADEPPPPLIFRHGAVVPHPSKRASTDDDADFIPQPPQAGHPSFLQQQRLSHHRRQYTSHRPSNTERVPAQPNLVTSHRGILPPPPRLQRVRQVSTSSTSSSSVSSPTPPAPPRRHMSPPPPADYSRNISTVRLSNQTTTTTTTMGHSEGRKMGFSLTGI